MPEWDVIIIGAGAAGLFCALEAGKRGRRVLVLEHSERVGKKTGISGGGRCNFTNIHTSPANFVSANPHFCKSALTRYTPTDFISLVEKHRIAYHEKKLGQLFCDERSQQIIDMLLRECRSAGVQIRCDCRVLSVRKDGAFRVETNLGTFVCPAVVIATGGLSIAPLGATDFGYRIARQFGLSIEEPRPGLVPLVLAPQMQKQLSKLSGVSIDGLVTCPSKYAGEFCESVLLTHRGLSGPAILQISTYWQPGGAIAINLLPDEDVSDILSQHQDSGIELANLLSRYLPRRFAQAWCELFVRSLPIRQYDKHELQNIKRLIHDLRISPAGTEGFKKAEVTAGGVSTAELSSQTMEAKHVSGLYFIGEVVDVTGHLGGYNFQWAWASGYAAGQFV